MTKSITEKKTAGDLNARLEKLTDRLNKRLRGGKIKSKLVKKGKSKNIPGFGYWFTN